MQSLRALPRTLSAARAFSTTAPRPLAKMQIIGRLAETPIEYPTSTGRNVIRYTIGTPYGLRDEKGNRKVSWFEVATFQGDGPLRELLLSLPKGTQLHVDAEARMEQYEDAATGKKRKGLGLIQRGIEILARPAQRDTSGMASESGETGGAESDTNAAEEPMSGVGAS